jgi:hypothetical protein
MRTIAASLKIAAMGRSGPAQLGQLSASISKTWASA